jgi:hypothetical protein
MQEIIRRRQQSGFVGRQDELARFRANFVLPVADPRHRFLYNISGVSGVGKTFLVRQLMQIAEERNALCAYADERAYDLPTTMQAIATE